LQNRRNAVDPVRIRKAWLGRVSGCLLGKAVEVLSFEQGREGLVGYLERAGALPLRDYVPLIEGTVVARRARNCCAGQMRRAEADDDIDYTLLALALLERFGDALTTADVARAWLNWLPGGATWTAERAAYSTLLMRMDDEFVNGAPPGFDIAECAENACNEWIGAQIRADLYGWVCPGDPETAVRLAITDAALSHQGEGVNGAAYIAALGALLPVSTGMDEALDTALQFIPQNSACTAAVRYAMSLGPGDQAVDRLHRRFGDLPPVHVVNNLATVAWVLANSGVNDFSAAIGNAVMAGWDTDCNGATVGGLMGLSGAEIPDHWTQPWKGRIGSMLAGIGETSVDDVVTRTVAVARNLHLKGTGLDQDN
jgi:ADP-ribosylglycohydrolase